MFTTPCFIRKNTKELRKKLEELGYFYAYYHKGDGIYCYNNIAQPFTYNNEIPKECIGIPKDNEELFLALAALRDDSDYMQWFVSTKTHIHRRSGCFGQVVGMDGYYKEIIGYEWYRHENKDNALTERLNVMIQMGVEDMEFLPHKATVGEIIEHFKDK